MPIPSTDAPALEATLRQKIDGKTKPPGSLGELEALALHLGLIQGTDAPIVRRPAIVVFAADHGIASRGVSAFPAEVTAQMVRNFASGGAAINVLTALHGTVLEVVDAGVRGELPALPGVTQARIADGTEDFSTAPAMTSEQLERALDAGAGHAHAHLQAGSTVIGFGEMGIGNTSSASLLLSLLADLPVASCVGPGTGLDAVGLARKCEVLTRAHARIAPLLPPAGAERARALLAECGGFEIAMMTGAMLATARGRAAVLVDGFIATSAALVGCAFEPRLREYCVFAHRSGEPGHRHMLEHLGARPLLDLDLRLGEGTGAALAIPLLQAAAAILRDMASFESAGVSGRSG